MLFIEYKIARFFSTIIFVAIGKWIWVSH
jgi:hypothetical protein